MPRNGSGGYSPPQNSWNPAINGQQATPNDWMAILNDMAAALQASVAADGQTPVTGIMNFSNNRISQVGAPIGSGDALRFDQMTKGADIASATTIAVPIEGSLFDVTGTTTITAIGDRFPGRTVYFRFADEVQLTHSSGLILPSGVTAKTSAGDVLCLMNVESGVWRVVAWPRFAAANYPSATEPTITWPLMTWADTGNMLLKRRNTANTTWITIGPLLDFYYSRDTVISAVSQSGGVPTGGLWQKTVNGNGTVYRNALGQQICRNDRFEFSNRSAGMFSELYATSELQWTFPAPFVDRCVFGGFAYEGAGATWSWITLGSGAGNLTTSAPFRVTGWQSQATGGYVSLFAIGNWF